MFQTLLVLFLMLLYGADFVCPMILCLHNLRYVGGAKEQNRTLDER